MSDVVRVVDSEVIDYESSAGTSGGPLAPALPAAKVEINIRPGVLDDFPFIDDLQKRHKKAVGFMWEAAIKGHIEKGNVLVAEATGGAKAWGLGANHDKTREPMIDAALDPRPQALGPTPVGYVLGVDRYLKRDELGIIYQMCVVPEYRRSLVAANLLKHKFETSAYGCRLYCCWCAQDLAANKFWEAMGFVPLAFRTGGGRRKKDGPRMHIFWQKRIRPRKFDEQTQAWVEDDYPYWFPSQTGAGAIGEDRIVLPIPPGSHWSEAKPIVLPNGPRNAGNGMSDEVALLEAEVGRLEKEKKAARKRAKVAGAGDRGAGAKPQAVRSVKQGGLHFGPPPPEVVPPAVAKAKQAAEEAAAIERELKEAKKAARKAKKKFDPAQEAFARELKDRWLEQVAAEPGLLAAGAARYDVSRQIAPGSVRNDTIDLENGERLRLPDAA